MLTLRSWALVHDFAVLMLDGEILADPALVDQVIDVRGSTTFHSWRGDEWRSPPTSGAARHG
ncbi:hypothetical protein [Hephaestia mangrovi]|uniref:hypothetical protein n=1 Tax=Hephaestia mangrovi TaxID=2873268 RepID=UPI001CA66186|nr:hypothetical protein [Hephaestia mangrovi]MBY8826899.1 hypothetical protein [Hephaestia mangrovi]